MFSSLGGRRVGAMMSMSRFGALLAAAGALSLLAACNPDDHPGALAGQPRGATVAFESIDGPPPGQFNGLVQALNNEAQTRRLAVMSRESPSAFRVRGYLAAKAAKHETTISWVWDVFDRDDHRTLRIAGEETAKGRRHDAWSAADDEMLRRIAHDSMEQLTAFLTSPEVAPGTPDSGPQMALTTTNNSSPEAAGIFRIFQANADPAPIDAAAAGPLPPPRPQMNAAVSARKTLTLAASSD